MVGSKVKGGEQLTIKLLNPKDLGLRKPRLDLSHKRIHTRFLKWFPQRSSIHVVGKQPEKLGHVLGFVELPLAPAHGFRDRSGRYGEGGSLEVGEQVVDGGTKRAGRVDA